MSRQPIPGLFDPSGASIVEQNPRRNLQSLLRAGDNHDVLRIAVHRTRSSEIGTYGFTQLLETEWSAVVQFSGTGISAVPHDYARPRLEWELVERWLAHIESPQPAQPREPFVRGKQLRASRRDPRTG